MELLLLESLPQTIEAIGAIRQQLDPRQKCLCRQRRNG
jgi:hypothetical protein